MGPSLWVVAGAAESVLDGCFELFAELVLHGFARLEEVRLAGVPKVARVRQIFLSDFSGNWFKKEKLLNTVESFNPSNDAKVLSHTQSVGNV